MDLAGQTVYIWHSTRMDLQYLESTLHLHELRYDFMGVGYSQFCKLDLTL